MAIIIVIDDEQSVLDMIERALAKERHTVYSFTSPQKGLDEMRKCHPDVVITDIKMEKLDGFDVLHHVKKINPEINVILITAYASVDTAVTALRDGAFDYLTKPFKINELRLAVKRALSEKKIVTGARKDSFVPREIVGNSSGMRVVKDLIGRVSKTDSTVLIYGESGTGKELVARAVHAESWRLHKPFVSINCAALPDSLLESELFGHEKGSFTGAVDSKIGLVEYAAEGTLFLDEIGETSLNIQVKLLHVLQDKIIKRVGGLTDIPVDVRIVAATSRHLEEEIKKGTFREDLFYRLNVVPIPILPLRERKDDIELLSMYFISLFNEKQKKKFRFCDEALQLFQMYEWPGNVRELENTIERILTLSEHDMITREIVETHLRRLAPSDVPRAQPSLSTLKCESATIEKDLIIKALQETRGNKTQAAKKLNVSKQNLQYYLKKFNLN
ncbi:MAG: sigma-54 dependent transcriptional regulator [Candidatus Omnitrophica bacterium]|nr:sigma-54 dependent transcriptional regulator [Candidatus Omnitrophota bacterium]